MVGERLVPVRRSSNRADRSFVRWAVGSYLIATAALVAVSLRRTGGHFIYLTDDPAIHLSVANNIAFHGTWGVVPDHFQSASSAPLWTLMLAAYLRIVPFATDLAPFFLNLAAGICLLVILGSNQKVLRPSRHRPLDAIAVVILVVVILLLPALAVLGMEHTLHMALVLGTVILFHKRALGEPSLGARWLPYALLAVATLVRFETMFVAAGIGLAFLALTLPGWNKRERRPSVLENLRPAVLAGAVSLGTFAVFATINRAMGQGWLPNSVLAKSQVTNGTGRLSAANILNRFTADPVLAVVVGACIGAVLLAWRTPVARFVFPAITVSIATALHVVFADVGWYDRYEAYLIALGVYALLVLAEEALPATRRPPARAFAVPALVMALLIFSATKVSLTVDVPKAVSDTYEQRYQAGRFLARYYQDQPVATGELGYISLAHRGPVTDLFGLGDYDVVQQRRRDSQKSPSSYWDQLARDRGFKVVAVYPETLLFNTPENWILVGDWTLNRSTVTAFDRTFQFWATTPEQVRPLEAQLREFQKTAPPGVQLHINELAEYRADKESQGG